MLPTFSRTLNLSPDASEALLSLPLTSLLDSPEFNQLLGSLDTALLKESLPTAGAVLAQKLPAFYDWLQTELGIKNVPDSPDRATIWVSCHAFKLHIQGGRDAHPTRFRLFCDIQFKCTTA